MSDTVIELSSDDSTDNEAYLTNDDTPKKVDNEASLTDDDTPKKVDPKVKVERIDSHHTLMIKGVNVKMPVQPYRCQVALMSKVLSALNKSENCILESPTGTGKTLALLCATLAWQQNDQNRYNEMLASELTKMTEIADTYNTPVKKFENLTTSTPDKLFNRPHFGQRSIYDAEQSSGDGSFSCSLPTRLKGQELPGNGASSLPSSQEKPSLTSSPSRKLKQEFDSYQKGKGSSSLSSSQEIRSAASTSRNLMRRDFDSYQKDNGEPGLVTIHKKQKLEEDFIDLTQGSYSNIPSTNTTPEKPKSQDNKSNSQENLSIKRVPTIYYGSRTHKQLEQVVREFERSPYCGAARMSLLSSRDYSCVRPYSAAQWPSRLDMCRACTKAKKKDDKSGDTCRYYENRAALTHANLPKAFNLMQLVETGQRKRACPYYAARQMAMASEIVFCPYNYLIDPIIRSNMNISLKDNILIIDEAHNIESVCRDAATFTVHQDKIAAAIKELETAAFYKFSKGADSYVVALKNSLCNWEYWFNNQARLLKTKAARKTPTELLYPWASGRAFVDTLETHNIGQTHYPVFSQNAQQLCRQMNEDPRALIGVSSATATLLETLDLLLGYLFKNNGENMEDFVMAIGASAETKFNKPYLSALCMSPGVVFAALRAARGVVLASATLAPVPALAAELRARFPHVASPLHVVPRERVWIGVVGACPQGTQLRLTYAQAREPRVQDAVGSALATACSVTPHGVLCFLPSYRMLDDLKRRWRQTGLWERLEELKHVFTEAKNVSDHDHVMEGYYESVGSKRGALLLAVYRGKVAEGMDFRDHQARLVVAVGMPFASRTELAVERKMQYNDIQRQREPGLLRGEEWYIAQAFRALNQALGRCIRHRADWGAVLLLDQRYGTDGNARRLPAWLYEQLPTNVYTFDQLERDSNGLQSFMNRMMEEEEFNSIEM